ncbi:signal peptidase I [Candidatus Scalindua japonica]|uniref:Signal peptidase I n=1 Tax=Candidatus Scalindua japonica TaxID=1284222 RepID=A0A286TUG3_9BACT|nr:S26 family signal peptidase [Candidatus Scalindua japonica]GAX59491.1 signal peptidase I [Candidatus Scalindua japonica]
MSKQELKNDKNKKKKQKGFFRENIESILIAVALAFILRIFIVEAFKIPTGSMAPTLLGVHKDVKCPNCNWKFKSNQNINYVKCSNCFYKIRISDNGRRGGSRILVNKFSYDFGSPRRWDVAVFKYPFADVTCMSCGFSSNHSMMCEKCTNLKKENFIKSKVNEYFKRSFGINQYHTETCKSCNASNTILCAQCGSTNVHVIRKNYIKRLIGLPDEKLQVINGDIYIDDKIARKPEKVQNALWVPVFSSNYPAKQEIVKNWETKDEYWDISKEQLHLKIPEGIDQKSYITFTRDIVDYSVYNSEITDGVSADIMLSFNVAATGKNGGVLILLEEDDKTYEVFIRSQGEKKESYLKISGSIVDSNATVFLEPGNVSRIKFSSADNEIVLKLNDTVVFSHTYDTELSSLDGHTKFSRLSFGGIHTEAVFNNIAISRDVYYSETGKWGIFNPVEIGKKEYFFMGDNSRNSNDSRYWKFVPESSMVGRAFMVFWPLSTIKIIK